MLLCLLQCQNKLIIKITELCLVIFVNKTRNRDKFKVGTLNPRVQNSRVTKPQSVCIAFTQSK